MVTDQQKPITKQVIINKSQTDMKDQEPGATQQLKKKTQKIKKVVKKSTVKVTPKASSKATNANKTSIKDNMEKSNLQSAQFNQTIKVVKPALEKKNKVEQQQEPSSQKVFKNQSNKKINKQAKLEEIKMNQIKMMQMSKNADLHYIQDFAAQKLGESDLFLGNKKNDNSMDDKSDLLCGRKRTYKQTKMRNSSSMKKQGNCNKDSDTLIVPESIDNFKAAKLTQQEEEMA